MGPGPSRACRTRLLTGAVLFKQTARDDSSTQPSAPNLHLQAIATDLAVPLQRDPDFRGRPRSAARDFEVSPITLSPDYLTRREYYTGPATAVREFIHNSKHKGAALNAANQWTDLTTHKVVLQI